MIIIIPLSLVTMGSHTSGGKPLEITPEYQNPNVYMHKNPKKFPFKKKKKNTTLIFIYLFFWELHL